MKLVFLAVLALNLPLATNAFPTGAGDCPGGRAAVGGIHVNPQASITTGSLEEGKLQMKINGQVLLQGSKLVLASGVEQAWTLSSAADTGFKGFLLRLSGGRDDTDTTVALSSASSSVQEAYAGTFLTY